MTGVHGITATDTTVGTTIGTFDDINTRNGTVRLQAQNLGIVGLLVAAAPVAQTTGTAVMGRIRMLSAELGLTGPDSTWALGATHGGGIATQSIGWAIPAEWIPLDFPYKGGLSANLQYSQMGIEPADNWAIAASVAHTIGVNPPAKWYDFAAMRGTLPTHGSISPNGGSVATTTRTTLTSADIPAKFKALVSMRNLQTQDPVQTTAEASVAWFEYTSNNDAIGVNQEWPSSAIAAALAGTLVGGGQHTWQPVTPWYVPVNAASNVSTLEPFVNQILSLTAANAYGWGVGARR